MNHEHDTTPSIERQMNNEHEQILSKDVSKWVIYFGQTELNQKAN